MNAALDGEIRNGRHHQLVRVYYEDTDFSGIVYHASYLRFMERGRTNYLRLIGADHRALFEQTEKEAPGFAFVVRSMRIEFLRPARMDDVLEVITTPVEVGGAPVAASRSLEGGHESKRCCTNRAAAQLPRCVDLRIVLAGALGGEIGHARIARVLDLGLGHRDRKIPPLCRRAARHGLF
jgi:acyl-CoA thioester hydrolase